MKTIYKMLLGALLGFLGAYCLLAAEFEMTLLDIAFEATLVHQWIDDFIDYLLFFRDFTYEKKSVSFGFWR